MTAPGGGGFEVVSSAVESAAEPMAKAYDALEHFGDEMQAAATLAGEGATGSGDWSFGPLGSSASGPLADVLTDFSDESRKRSIERGEECYQLSKAMREAVETYRSQDDDAAGDIRNVPFGHTTG